MPKKYISKIHRGSDDLYIKDAEAREAISQIDISAIAAKANKVTGATAGNLASLDSNGDLADSGYSSSSFVLASDFATSAQCISAANELT